MSFKKRCSRDTLCCKVHYNFNNANFSTSSDCNPCCNILLKNIGHTWWTWCRKYNSGLYSYFDPKFVHHVHVPSLSPSLLSSYNGPYWIMIWCPIMIYFAHNKKCDDLNYNVDYWHRRVMFLQVIIVDW